MTAFVDFNVLIRHLTGDPPDLAARATSFLAEADELLLPDLIVAEIVCVLESHCEVPTDEVARLVRSAIAFAPIQTLDPALLLRSLEVYETHGIDFAAAHLMGSAEAAGMPDGRSVTSPDNGTETLSGLQRPVAVLNASGHIAYASTLALQMAGVTNSVKDTPGAEYGRYEDGTLNGVLYGPRAWLPVMMATPGSPVPRTTSNGVTTVGDLSTGQVDWDLEVAALERNLAAKGVPFRTALIPGARALSIAKGGIIPRSARDSTVGLAGSEPATSLPPLEERLGP